MGFIEGIVDVLLELLCCWEWDPDRPKKKRW